MFAIGVMLGARGGFTINRNCSDHLISSRQLDRITRCRSALLIAGVHGVMGCASHPNLITSYEQLVLWPIGQRHIWFAPGSKNRVHELDEVLCPLSWCYRGTLVNFHPPFPMKTKEYYTDLLDICLAGTYYLEWGYYLNQCRLFVITYHRQF